jgi:pimeloyl-ACP methyl ester carboxylesterase
VVGNSIGGWVAAEMTLLNTGRVERFALVDAVGIVVPDHPVADFFSLSFAELAQLSYHAPEKFRIDPSTMPPAALATMATNREAIATYAGTAMADPTLADRLAGATTPTLVVFGEADRIVDPDYGRAYAAAIPGARFHLLPETGHLPQLETPEQLTDVLRAFLGTAPASRL